MDNGDPNDDRTSSQLVEDVMEVAKQMDEAQVEQPRYTILPLRVAQQIVPGIERGEYAIEGGGKLWVV